jgi:hypothetical protein
VPQGSILYALLYFVITSQFHMALAGLHERMKNGGWRGTVARDGSSGKGRVYLVLRAR